jgi:hypothetical protein
MSKSSVFSYIFEKNRFWFSSDCHIGSRNRASSVTVENAIEILTPIKKFTTVETQKVLFDGSQARDWYFPVLTADLFYGTLVKRKVERPLFFSWIRTFSQRKQKDHDRFLVATWSALYLSKRGVFGKTLKITKIFPWVTLNSVKVIEPTCVEFVFGPRIVVTHLESAENILSVLSPFFASFFPENYPFEFNSPYGDSPEKLIPQRQLLPSIYVSFCHSLEIPMNDVLFSFLQKECAKSSNRLNISKLEIDSRTASALVPTLAFTRGFRFLRVNGATFSGVFKGLSEILAGHPHLAELVISNADNFKYFDEFLAAIDRSNIIVLGFSDLWVAADRMTALMNCERISLFQALVFSECRLDAASVKVLTKHSAKLNSLYQLSIRHNKDAFTRSEIKKLLKMCCEHSVTRLELSFVSLNLSHLFPLLAPLQFLQTLIVAGNHCEDPVPAFSLPPSLIDIDLSYIKWKPLLLLQVLTETSYNPLTRLKLAGIVLTSNDWNSVLDHLHQIHFRNTTIAELDWSENMLDTRVITFLAALKSLKGLQLNRCLYSDDKIHPILNGLTALIQGQPITRFEMRGAKKRLNTVVVRGLFKTFAEQNVLCELDVTDNRLGTEGLADLNALAARSTSLRTLAFDGSKPSKVTALTKLFATLAASQSILRVRPPTKDIDSIVSKTPAMKDMLKSGWKNLTHKISDRKASCGFGEDDEESISQRAECSTSTAFATPLPTEVHSIAPLVASWSVEINLPFNTGFMEWEEMKQKYSLTAVSGIDIG